ncbi:hypothetical protein NDU88_010014 [Pleurodeles waltl]|uniref:SGNH hydrolase-type esterase domain-containing protein n=1 Tax=Pleurodeles waltl TaxID=8319 RepID=A0AAV7QV58_PLEWA|nr:hypothetical protein NDU88_010014 [Pleurodeles waltl]
MDRVLTLMQPALMSLAQKEADGNQLGGETPVVEVDSAPDQGQGKSTASARRHISAVAFFTKLVGGADHSRSFLIRQALKGWERLEGSIPDQRCPIAVDKLEKILGDLTGICDQDLSVYHWAHGSRQCLGCWTLLCVSGAAILQTASQSGAGRRSQVSLDSERGSAPRWSSPARRGEPPPALIILHVGGNDLPTIGRGSVFEDLMEISWLAKRCPGAVIEWSHIIPWRIWKSGRSTKALDESARRLNIRMKQLLNTSVLRTVAHGCLHGEAMFQDDGVRLSDGGHIVFVENLVAFSVQCLSQN